MVVDAVIGGGGNGPFQLDQEKSFCTYVPGVSQAEPRLRVTCHMSRPRAVRTCRADVDLDVIVSGMKLMRGECNMTETAFCLF